MANLNIHNPIDFSTELRKLETTDRAHADTFNGLFEQLINNDAYLKDYADKKINGLVDGAPQGMNTLKELGDAIESGVSELKGQVETHLADSVYQVAGGTATAITLTTATLIDGYAKTFIASANNSGAATTINSKPLYKPGTTTAPNLIAGKAYTVWYNVSQSCFFIKASAEGDAIAGNVLAGKKFSNDNDTGLVGTLDLTNLTADNIKKDVTINGTTGNKLKYSIGDTLALKNTTSKSAIIDYCNAMFVSGSLIGEDLNYYYVCESSTPSGLYAVDKITGTKTWFKQNFVPIAILSVNDTYLYALTSSTCVKIKISDGTVVWTANITNVYATSGKMAIINNILYVIFFTGRGSAVYYMTISIANESSFTKINEISIYNDANNLAMFLEILDDNTFCFFGSTIRYRFNLLTGTVINTSSINYSAGVLDYFNQVFYNINANFLYCYNVNDGSLIWSYAHNVGAYVALNCLCVKDGVIIWTTTSNITKIKLNGSVDYKIIPYIYNIGAIAYNRSIDSISCLLVCQISNSSYCVPARILDKIKIIS